MKFCYDTNFTLPRQSQRSRSVLQDGSRSLGLFWKEKTLSYNQRNTAFQEDTALAAMLKAAEVDGSVRVISKDTGQGHEVDQAVDSTRKGVTQVRYITIS